MSITTTTTDLGAATDGLILVAVTTHLNINPRFTNKEVLDLCSSPFNTMGCQQSSIILKGYLNLHHHTAHQQLLPLIMPSHPTWPSMLTNPASYSAPPVAIPPASAPVVKGNGTKLPAIHATPSPRKTLTDSDRRRMCQYHEENPTVKQTEIGGKKISFSIFSTCC